MDENLFVGSGCISLVSDDAEVFIYTDKQGALLEPFFKKAVKETELVERMLSIVHSELTNNKEDYILISLTPVVSEYFIKIDGDTNTVYFFDSFLNEPHKIVSINDIRNNINNQDISLD